MKVLFKITKHVTDLRHLILIMRGKIMTNSIFLSLIGAQNNGWLHL